jgi:GNAT superfamily N-acetyltransferase
MIRPALPSEYKTLTDLSFRSKAVWNYPQTYFDIWVKEFTLSSDYIQNNDVFVFETNKTILGYYSLVILNEDLLVTPDIKIESGLWLEHMFIEPQHIGSGLGKKLFIHCIEQSELKSYEKLKTLSDPNASQFYIKMGCRYVKEYPSTIENRTTPYLEYLLTKTNKGDL